MVKTSSNPLTFFVVLYAFLISAFALSGYTLNYLDLRLDALNMLFLVLIIAVLIYLAFPITIPERPTKTDLLILVISLLVSARFTIFFTSNYPVGSSVDLAHYYFASDWIQTHSNMAFFDYRNAPDYYYLWHTWPLNLWYFGYEFISVFISSVFDINILNSMQILVGMSGFVTILCMGLIGSKILDDWRAGVMTMLQLAAMPATFLLAYDGFFANITALSIGLVLAYISIDRVKIDHLPIIFILIAGGFLIHIHTMAFMLGIILLYKIISCSSSQKNEFLGYILTVGSGFTTAYILNPLVFDQWFGVSNYIIIGSGKKGTFEVPFAGFENLFGYAIFLIIGIVGTYMLYRNRSRTNLFQIVWFSSFIGAFIFLLASGKMHWANRMAYIAVFPLAISCAALYIEFYKNSYTRFGKVFSQINFNKIVLILISITLILSSAYLRIDRVDLDPLMYDLGLQLRNIDNNSTISYIQYPESFPNSNKFFISAYSRHRIAWPVVKPDILTYENMKNISYTNDYIPEWEGRIPEKYTTFENFDAPKYILVMFVGSSKNYMYYLFDTNQLQNLTCQNVLTNKKGDNCSVHMDFINDDYAMAMSGFYNYEPEIGPWTSGTAKVMLPTIEQKGGTLRISAGAFRPEGLGKAHVDVYLNDVLIGNFTAGNEYAINTFKLDSKLVSKPFSVVTFNTSTWIPDEVIKNGDTREIGIRFSSIEFISD